MESITKMEKYVYKNYYKKRRFPNLTDYELNKFLLRSEEYNFLCYMNENYLNQLNN